MTWWGGSVAFVYLVVVVVLMALRKKGDLPHDIELGWKRENGVFQEVFFDFQPPISSANTHTTLFNDADNGVFVRDDKVFRWSLFSMPSHWSNLPTVVLWHLCQVAQDDGRVSGDGETSGHTGDDDDERSARRIDVEQGGASGQWD